MRHCLCLLVCLLCCRPLEAAEKKAPERNYPSGFNDVEQRQKVAEFFENNPDKRNELKGMKLVLSDLGSNSPLHNLDLDRDGWVTIVDAVNFKMAESFEQFLEVGWFLAGRLESPGPLSGVYDFDLLLKALRQRFGAYAVPPEMQLKRSWVLGSAFRQAELKQNPNLKETPLHEIDRLVFIGEFFSQRLKESCAAPTNQCQLQQHDLRQLQLLPTLYRNNLRLQAILRGPLLEVDVLSREIKRELVHQQSFIPEDFPVLRVDLTRPLDPVLVNYYRDQVAWLQGKGSGTEWEEIGNELARTTANFAKQSQQLAGFFDKATTSQVNKEQLLTLRLDGALTRSLAGLPRNALANVYSVFELLSAHIDVTSTAGALTSSQQLAKVIAFLNNLYAPIYGQPFVLRDANTALNQRGPMGLNMNTTLQAWKSQHWQAPYQVDSSRDRYVIVNHFESYLEKQYQLTAKEYLALPKTRQDEMIAAFKDSDRYKFLLESMGIVPVVATYFKIIDQIAQIGPWSLDLNHDGKINWTDVDVAQRIESLS